MLTSASVTANIPAADLDRARAVYADTLGLTPAMEVPEGAMLIYRTDGGTMFSVYQTEFAGQAGHTIAQLHVDDVVANMGAMGQAAWFKDSEGNILCLDSGYPEG